MISSGVHRDNFDCWVLVEGYQGQGHLILFLNMVVELYYFLMINLCKEKRPFATKNILKALACDGYEPNPEIYSYLIDTFSQCNHMEEALLFKDEMELKNIKLSLVVCRDIICCLCRLSRSKEAEDIMTDMIEPGI